ncbi:MAG: hypothetical protein ACR2HI_05860 [Gaiella sp.]
MSELASVAQPRRVVALCALVVVSGLCVAAAIGAVLRSADIVSQRERLLDGSLPRGKTSALVFLGDHAQAVEHFGKRISVGSRFVVVGEHASSPLYRQLTRYYFFPALSVKTPQSADYLVQFESGAVPMGFERVAFFGDAWLARRTR